MFFVESFLSVNSKIEFAFIIESKFAAMKK